MEYPFVLFCPLAPGCAPSPRFSAALAAALAVQKPDFTFTALSDFLAYTRAKSVCGTRFLFAVQLEPGGINLEFSRLVAALRTTPGLLAGSFGSVMVDCPSSECYTKSAARTLVLAGCGAGCAFPGKCLVEATASLTNFATQARNAGITPAAAYPAAAAALVERLLSAAPPPRKAAPNILVVHASMHATSNTLALWESVRRRVQHRCPGAEISEINLRNGTLADCAGCAYKTCLHFGERSSCFYGGVMVEKVFPALQKADALVLLCPNYNDSLSANLLAFINRLTALFRAQSFAQKQLFALVVSGYSGSDLVAEQIVGALNINKGFYLPAGAILQKTANDAGAALRLPGIETALELYSANLCAALCSDSERGSS